jgi:hypothetical protein
LRDLLKDWFTVIWIFVCGEEKRISELKVTIDDVEEYEIDRDTVGSTRFDDKIYLKTVCNYDCDEKCSGKREHTHGAAMRRRTSRL